MSIILQALKKAEGKSDDDQEVQGFDQVPELQAAVNTEAGTKPPVLIIAVVFFLLVSISLVTWLVYQKSQSPPAVPVSSGTSRTTVAANGSVSREAPPARQQPVPSANTGAARGNPGATLPLARQAAPATAADTPVTAPPQRSAKPATPPADTEAGGGGKVVTAAEPLSLAPTEVPDRPGPAAEAETPSSDSDDGNALDVDLLDVPLLIEKPFEFQQAMPKISIDVHVYSDDVQRRFAIINMKKFRERDKIEEGLYVHTITADGVVLQFRNELVKLRAR